MNLIDRKKLALIHIIKKELNLANGKYREILRLAAGVNSAKQLDERKFRKLMQYFVRSKHYQVNPFGLTIRQKLYIQSLAKDMAWSEIHLNNFVHKYYHKSRIDDLSKSEAIKLIESLKNILRHDI